MVNKPLYSKGDLIIVRGRALSENDNAFFVGIVLDVDASFKTMVVNDLWKTKKRNNTVLYKVIMQGKIKTLTDNLIKGKL